MPLWPREVKRDILFGPDPVSINIGVFVGISVGIGVFVGNGVGQFPVCRVSLGLVYFCF